eukprot:TRINITY_DN70862_c0_g1_i1.p1 TRINITY_DN70862_c0_g1~~TRINITY_DN70862_c0_g1_i1.p1  ORF type:complete len:415 (-),score=141.22 TRINITY_DN70862_c0_g1_i1:102-1346(-)
MVSEVSRSIEHASTQIDSIHSERIDASIEACVEMVDIQTDSMDLRDDASLLELFSSHARRLQKVLDEMDLSIPLDRMVENAEELLHSSSISREEKQCPSLQEVVIRFQGDIVDAIEKTWQNRLKEVQSVPPVDTASIHSQIVASDSEICSRELASEINKISQRIVKNLECVFGREAGSNDVRKGILIPDHEESVEEDEHDPKTFGKDGELHSEIRDLLRSAHESLGSVDACVQECVARIRSLLGLETLAVGLQLMQDAYGQSTSISSYSKDVAAVFETRDSYLVDILHCTKWFFSNLTGIMLRDSGYETKEQFPTKENETKFFQSYRDKLDGLLQKTRAISQDVKGDDEVGHGLLESLERVLPSVMHGIFEVVDFFFSFARIMNRQNALLVQSSTLTVEDQSEGKRRKRRKSFR